MKFSIGQYSITINNWIFILLGISYVIRYALHVNDIYFLAAILGIWILHRIYIGLKKLFENPNFWRTFWRIRDIFLEIVTYVCAAIFLYLIVSDFITNVEKQPLSQYKTLDVIKKADVLLLCDSFELGNDVNFESSLYEKCLLNEDTEKERKDAMEKTQFELRIVIQNSTPVDQPTSILYVFDSSYLVSFMVCSFNKWEISLTNNKKITESDAEIQEFVIDNEREFFPSWKKIAILTVVGYQVYKAFHGEGIARLVLVTAKESFKVLFNNIAA